MVKGFLLFFVQDTFQFHDLAREQAVVGDASIAAETTAATAAVVCIAVLRMVPAQDRTLGADAVDLGTARAQRTCMAGAAWMALLWLVPPMIGLGVLQERRAAIGNPDVDAIAQHWVRWMIVGTATWGIGQGTYLAGDQALGYALLPDRNEASRYLGLTSVYSSLGAVLGGTAAGGLLQLFGAVGRAPPLEVPGSSGPGYAYAGYAAMFLFAVCLSAGSYKMLSLIHPVAGIGEHTRLVK